MNIDDIYQANYQMSGYFKPLLAPISQKYLETEIDRQMDRLAVRDRETGRWKWTDWQMEMDRQAN